MVPSATPAVSTFDSAILETLLHKAPIGFAFLDRSLRFVVVNDKLAQINGLPAEWHIGRQVSEIVPTLAATISDVTERILKTGEPVLNHEFTGETAASPGEQRWWNESWYPVHGPHGELVGFGAMVEDITERKRAEAAVEAARERRRKALSIETVGRLVFNLKGRILEANAAYERMSGYSADELRAMPHLDALTPPEYANVTARAVEELATLGRTAAYEKEHIRKDGSRWWGLFAPTRVSGEGPESECVEFIIDITHSKRIESELREADRRKNEFLATLAHELRNPMAPLRNGLHIVRLSSELDSPVHRVVEIMERQLNHLVRLVDDLLDVGRITSGKVELRRKRVGLREVLASSIEACEATIDAHHHELKVDEGKEELFVDGDFERLTQVFSNLLGNAAKYTEDGGSITVTARRDGSDAVVQVIDTGIGIPKDQLAHVFDLFSQVRAHQGRAEGGLGIGLSLVKQLVAMHGGTVHAESKGPGKGTTFTVRLPLVPRPNETKERSSSGVVPTDGQRLRLLVVDDNVDVASSLKMLLELSGHEVAVVHSGPEAIEKVRKHAFNAALLDIGMPDMDGIETARRLRDLANGKKMPIVAVTGWGQENDRERTREAGFDYHLVKPVDPTKITDLLKNLASTGVGAAGQDGDRGSV